MGSRTSFRPRPLDTGRQLNIVRDVNELDDGEQKVSRDIVHCHEALDKDNEEVLHHFSRGIVRVFILHEHVMLTMRCSLHLLHHTSLAKLGAFRFVASVTSTCMFRH